MKNDVEKLIPTRKYHASPRLTYEFRKKLNGHVKLLFVNRDFVEFIEVTIKKLPAKDKIECLYYFLKLAKQMIRQPDPEWFKANEDLYLEEMSSLKDEQVHFEPVKWIKAEIEYMENTIEKLTKDDVNKELDIMMEAKQKLSKPWLTKDDVIALFSISESTLNRWLYNESMPHYKKGKFMYWYMDEITEWMKKEAA